MFPKGKAFLIYCSTGCTCCSDENHYTGPWRTREDAETQVNYYRQTRRVASQYSENGNYSISEIDIEKLPDGRLILDGRIVVAGFALEDGNESELEYF